MQKKIVGIFVCTLLIVTSTALTSTTLAHWDKRDGHKMHYPQLPDPNGWDVDATYRKSEQGCIALADDWQCSKSGLIKDIHFWGSWKNDDVGTIYSFTIGIAENIPPDSQITWSRPGEILWSPRGEGGAIHVD